MSSGFFEMLSCPVSFSFAILLARLAIGLSLLPYGLKKYENLKKFNNEHQPPDIFQVGPLTARQGFISVMLIESLVPCFLILGLFTRLAVIPCIVNMAVAFKTTYKTKSLEAPSLPFLLMMIVFLITGAGEYSLDYLFSL